MTCHPLDPIDLLVQVSAVNTFPSIKLILPPHNIMKFQANFPKNKKDFILVQEENFSTNLIRTHKISQDQDRYPQPSTLGKISFSMRQKLKYNPKNEIPGPGQYNTISSVQQRYPLSKYRSIAVPKMKGQSGRNQSYETSVPGPGQYMPNAITTQRSSLFSKDKRELFQKQSITPGVGNYHIPSEFGSRSRRMNTIY